MSKCPKCGFSVNQVDRIFNAKWNVSMTQNGVSIYAELSDNQWKAVCRISKSYLDDTFAKRLAQKMVETHNATLLEMEST